MRRKPFVAFVALLLVASVAQAGGTLTEEQIKQMAASIETAARQRDAPGVMRHFAPDATILIVMPPETGLQTKEGLSDLGLESVAERLNAAGKMSNKS